MRVVCRRVLESFCIPTLLEKEDDDVGKRIRNRVLLHWRLFFFFIYSIFAVQLTGLLFFFLFFPLLLVGGTGTGLSSEKNR